MGRITDLSSGKLQTDFDTDFEADFVADFDISDADLGYGFRCGFSADFFDAQHTVNYRLERASDIR